MFEAKSDLSRFVKMLESKEDDVIYIDCKGVEVAQLTLIPSAEEKRIGAAKGCFSVPDEFDSDSWNSEIEDLFECGEV